MSRFLFLVGPLLLLTAGCPKKAPEPAAKPVATEQEPDEDDPMPEDDAEDDDDGADDGPMDDEDESGDEDEELPIDDDE